ncbi:hypothetical protein QEH56_08565 [Pelagicoccus enzymogenes]|uniref:hypothetical protein n=1 Tax=Pelagicoccus enzymogenes TaxID=2773457 RepID=UPI00280CFCD3|nr:hypothetical protein [Pelagicoccus enzymogenes]MDQ8198195.1 hypothetical protein [Pelagicoccus enzymogenes]
MSPAFRSLQSILPAFAICIVTLGALPGCETSSSTSTQQDTADPTQVYAARIQVDGIGDDLEARIEVNTVNCFKYRHGLLQVVWNDAFLRGYIDKETGNASYQIYTIQFHDDWAFPYQANYGSPLHTTEARRIYSDVDCRHHDCDCEEHAVFEVAPEELDRIAALAESAENKHKDWRFRIKNQQASDVDFNLPYAEIAAFKQQMDALSKSIRSPEPTDHPFNQLPPSLSQAFIDGSLDLISPTLTKGYGAAAKSRTAIAREKELLENEDWEGLVKEIMAHRFGDNLHFHLLGVAAEGLGYTEAAIIYYEKSIEQSNRPLTGKCIACMGFQLPRESMDALERMNHESP